MKHRPLSTPLIGILVVGFCFALPGWAQSPTKMSPAKMTCEDFVAVDSAYQPTLVYWAAGVDKLGIRELAITHNLSAQVHSQAECRPGVAYRAT